MRPRPRSRKRDIDYVAPEDLIEDVRACRRETGDPAGIISSPREWALTMQQPGARPFVRAWPGDGFTFDGVPVIVRRDLGAPRVLATQADLEDALLGRDD